MIYYSWRCRKRKWLNNFLCHSNHYYLLNVFLERFKSADLRVEHTPVTSFFGSARVRGPQWCCERQLLLLVDLLIKYLVSMVKAHQILTTRRSLKSTRVYQPEPLAMSRAKTSSRGLRAMSTEFRSQFPCMNPCHLSTSRCDPNN